MATGTDATFADFVERWLERAESNRSPSNVVRTKSALRTNILPLLGPIKLKKLRAADLDRFYAEPRKRPGRKGDNLSPATIRGNYVIIHSALQHAAKWGWIAVNPAVASWPPKVRQVEISPPAPGELARLLAMVEAEDPDLFTFLRLAVNSGARRSQLCALQWRDIDLTTGAVKVASAVVGGEDGIVVKHTKIDRIYRLTLDTGTIDSLVHHRKRMEERAELCGVELTPTSFVFSYEPDCSTLAARRRHGTVGQVEAQGGAQRGAAA